jgi:hypothetical protein
MRGTLRNTVLVSIAALAMGLGSSAFAAGSGIMQPQGNAGGFHGGGAAFGGGGGNFHSNGAGAFRGGGGAAMNGGALRNNGGGFHGGNFGRHDGFHNGGGLALGLGLGALGAGAYGYGYNNDYVDSGNGTNDYAANDENYDEDSGCLKVRRVYDEDGNYVGRRTVDVCQ